MKTYEEAVSIVAEVRLSGLFNDVGSVFNYAGAVLLAKIYEKSEIEVSNDCYDLIISRVAARKKAINEARREASRAKNEERRLNNLESK